MSSYPRYRTRTDLLNKTVRYRWQGDSFGTSYTAGSEPQFTYYDIMSDFVNRKTRDGRYPYTSCDHIRVRADVKPWQPFRGDSGLLHIIDEGGLHLDPTAFLDMLPAIPPALWNECAGRAFTTFYTQFPEEISIGNFLFELRELGDLLPKIERTLSKTVSGGYLNLEFGWKPLLDDLKTLALTASGVEKRLAWLRKTYGKTVKLGHYEGNVHSVGPIADKVFSSRRAWVTRYRAVGYRCEFRAGAYLHHTLANIDDTVGLMRAFIGALGLSNPVKAVWNGLPYSFVVDWFLKISERLDLLTNFRDATGQWQVFGTGCSMKQSVLVDVIQENPDVHDWSGVNPPIKVGTVTVERYVRRFGLPVDSSVYSLSGLDPRQLTLTLALLNK